MVAAGAEVVCHGCGEPLAAVTGAHAGRHGLDLAGYRERFGSNRKASLVAPALADRRREEGHRRYALGAAAQPAGSRRAQGHRAAGCEGASPALRGHRQRQSAAVRERWAARARELGFADLEGYLCQRRAEGASAHRVRVELRCGGSVAASLMRRDS